MTDSSAAANAAKPDLQAHQHRPARRTTVDLPTHHSQPNFVTDDRLGLSLPPKRTQTHSQTKTTRASCSRAVLGPPHSRELPKPYYRHHTEQHFTTTTRSKPEHASSHGRPHQYPPTTPGDVSMPLTPAYRSCSQPPRASAVHTTRRSRKREILAKGRETSTSNPPAR